ncbi:MAG: hypothetical protein ACE5DW_02635 [Thermodesulfobacteriota bacterium]
MRNHREKVVYDKGVKHVAEKGPALRLLEKEEVGIILIFTAIMIAALLITYVL